MADRQRNSCSQQTEGWGTGIIARLSRDLHAAFPEMKGFPTRNLGYMKVFAKTYPDETILQQPVAKLPWGHQIALMEQVKDEQERFWYIEPTLAYGWSRSMVGKDQLPGIAEIEESLKLHQKLERARM